MPALADMLLAHAVADPRADLVAGERRDQQFAAGEVGVALRHREQGRQGDGADMQHAVAVHVVELEALHLRAVDQRGIGRGQRAVGAPDRGRRGSRRASRTCPGDPAPFQIGAVDAAAERVEDQELQPLAHVCGNLLVADAARRIRRSCGCGRCRCWNALPSSGSHRRGERGGTRNVLSRRQKSRQPGLRCLQSPGRKANVHAAARARGRNFGSDLRSAAGRGGRRAKQGILDTVGVTLAGARDETTAVVASALRQTAAPGPALIFGTSERVDVLDAALINGTASHALDFDDCSNTLGGHPSAPILPALWAIAPGSSGKAFIAAYAAGFECETRFARAVNFHHYEKGWHPTATLGTFGSAAACGHLLALSVEQTRHRAGARGLDGVRHQGQFRHHDKAVPCRADDAQRLAGGVAREGGHDRQRRRARASARASSRSTTAPATSMRSACSEHWGDPFDLADPGIAFKRHPCCGCTHPAVDAMLHLRETHGLSPERVAKVESWTHPRRLAHTNRPDPQSGLDGKFSIQYVLARALMHGIVSMEHFSDEAVRDPATRALMTRVHCRARSRGEAARPTSTSIAGCEITTDGGRDLRAFRRPSGRPRPGPSAAGRRAGSKIPRLREDRAGRARRWKTLLSAVQRA